MKTTLLPRTFISWLPLGFAISVLSLLVYTAVQQDQRQGANMPQVQMAEDVAVMMQSGSTPQAIVGSGTIDIAHSLATFVTIVGTNGTVLASNARIDSSTPVPPKGVLTATDDGAENRVTWQPQSGVRLATVVKKYSTTSTSGYVIVGRNMREVERQESYTGMATAGFWIVGVLGSFLLMLFGSWMKNNEK